MESPINSTMVTPISGPEPTAPTDIAPADLTDMADMLDEIERKIVRSLVELVDHAEGRRGRRQRAVAAGAGEYRRRVAGVQDLDGAVSHGRVS